jgi:hypothetical protein
MVRTKSGYAIICKDYIRMECDVLIQLKFVFYIQLETILYKKRILVELTRHIPYVCNPYK